MKAGTPPVAAPDGRAIPQASGGIETPCKRAGADKREGAIYVAGGEVRDSHMDAIFRDVEVFDPAINDWLRLPPMPTARHGVNLAALGNRLFAIGGHIAFATTGSANCTRRRTRCSSSRRDRPVSRWTG